MEISQEDLDLALSLTQSEETKTYDELEME